MSDVSSCSSYRHDEHTDPSCALKYSHMLRLDRVWGSESALGIKRAHQTDWDFHNWWVYERRTARWMLNRTERVLSMPFVDFWVGARLEASFFYNLHVGAGPFLRDAERLEHPQQSKNVLEAIQAAFPAAYAACCTCARTAGLSLRRPCSQEDDLWSRCFAQHATARQVGRFLVDDLGMLGLFGHYFRSVPRRLLEEEPRLAWQVNNGPAGGWNFSSHNVSMQLPGWTWPPNAECDSQAQATLCVTTTRLSMA